jgi:hypothetical protein
MFEILPYELKLIPYKYEFTMNFSARILEDFPALNLTSTGHEIADSVAPGTNECRQNYFV